MVIVVEDDQLSLAIGKGGQNARLAAKLTGWKVNILSETDYFDKKREEAEAKVEVSKLPIGDATIKKLIENDYKFVQDILEVPASRLTEIEGIGPKKADQIIDAARDYIFQLQATKAEADQLEGDEVEVAAEPKKKKGPKSIKDLFVDDDKAGDDAGEDKEKK